MKYLLLVTLVALSACSDLAATRPVAGQPGCYKHIIYGTTCYQAAR